MNALIEEHTISHLDSTRTDNKEMESPENFCYRNGFNNLLRKLNVIIEKIKLKRQKAKKKKWKMVWYDYLKKCVLARLEEHQTCFYFQND